MGNNQHLKRHSAPSAWSIKRKNITFVTKPNPGSYKTRYVVPVIIIIRDILKYAETSKEVKLIIHNQEVLLNGKKVIDIKTPVGMFDILEIKEAKEKYMVLFDNFGKIKLISVKDNLLYLKVNNKKQVKSGGYQLNFMNGFNLLVDEKVFNSVNVEDTVIFDYVKKKIEKVLPLAEKSFVYMFDGKFKGFFGEVKKFDLYNGLTKDNVQIDINNVIHTTAKDYCFVVGTKKEDLKKFK
ncbi:MAG: hypothetical protein ACOC16_03325 [Nanoarchaeota archaeon]